MGVGNGGTVFGVIFCLVLVGVVVKKCKRNQNYERMGRREGPVHFDPNLSDAGGRISFGDSREGIDQMEMRTFFETDTEL